VLFGLNPLSQTGLRTHARTASGIGKAGHLLTPSRSPESAQPLPLVHALQVLRHASIPPVMGLSPFDSCRVQTEEPTRAKPLSLRPASEIAPAGRPAPMAPAPAASAILARLQGPYLSLDV